MNLHNAPPVVYPVGRSHFLATSLAALWCAGLLATLLWVHGSSRVDWRTALAFSAILGTGIAARAGWIKLPSGEVAWDGQAWRWQSPGYRTNGTEHEVSVIADLQHALLLRLENPDRANLWLWLEQSAMPDRWLDLRRAVYSPHKSPAARQHDALPDDRARAARDDS